MKKIKMSKLLLSAIAKTWKIDTCICLQLFQIKVILHLLSVTKIIHPSHRSTGWKSGGEGSGIKWPFSRRRVLYFGEWIHIGFCFIAFWNGHKNIMNKEDFMGLFSQISFSRVPTSICKLPNEKFIHQKNYNKKFTIKNVQ